MAEHAERVAGGPCAVHDTLRIRHPRDLGGSRDWRRGQRPSLSVTFSCGLVIALAHVLNRTFVAPGYDVVLNLTAFMCAVAVR
jgi:hypothetical protein